MTGSTPEISVIVPALNEAESLPILVPRLAAAFAAMGKADQWELLIVDDNSKDATPQVCAELAKQYPVQLLVRLQPRNGLSGAVLHGMAAARGRLLVSMDADLQHPPEKVPELLAVLEKAPADGGGGGGDFALGSRYVPGASMDGEWGLFRQINSWVATALARPFAGKVRDPMSGFFALSRATFDRAENLTPLGYKIALELICKCRVKQVREVPIHFGLRQKGESKLSLKQQFHYLEHLSRLYDFTFPRAAPMAKFLISLGFGWLAAGLVLKLLALTHALPEDPRGWTTALLLAYAANLLVTALFHARYVRTQREFLVRPTVARDFILISLAEWLTAGVVANWLLRRVDHLSLTELFLYAFGAATVVRYILRKELLLDLRGLRRDLPRERELPPTL